MSESTAETIAWVAAIIGTLGLVLAHAVYSIDLYWVRRHHARFPMFAARDRLVQLVADGQVSEGDLAWAIAYTGTNHWLSFDHSHTVWSALRAYLRHELRASPDQAQMAEYISKFFVGRAKQVPEFGEVLLEIDQARFVMLRERTHWWRFIKR